MNDTSDRPLVDLLRRRGPSTVEELAREIGVTATAVRARLTRLLGSGMIVRIRESGGRGRPRHRYQVSEEAQKRLGQNYADLAVVLWDEMMNSVEDRELRRELFRRIVDRLAELYRAQIGDTGWKDRMVHLGSILHDRGIEAEVTLLNGDHSQPILRQHSCPYHALAEVDRAICSLERKMFEKVLGLSLRLSQCRLDGHRSCDFEPRPDSFVHLIAPMPTTTSPGGSAS